MSRRKLNSRDDRPLDFDVEVEIVAGVLIFTCKAIFDDLPGRPTIDKFIVVVSCPLSGPVKNIFEGSGRACDD